MNNATPAFPVKTYSVIYADPPWAWGKTALINRGSARAVEKEYQTMQPDEICALPVQTIAKDDAVIFLWVTGPKLPLGIEVLRAWGFEYKSVAFVWVKRNKIAQSWFTGMGFYTRQNAEFVLLGTRGKTSTLVRKDRGIHQIVDAPISIHSRKPDDIRKRIDRLYDGDKIELFARQTVQGWDAWGLGVQPATNDVDAFFVV